MPKYSIVVPTLDRAHLLEGALESLSRLNHDSFEVIVSNNVSSDNTEAVAKRWVEADPRFRYLQTTRRLAMADHWDFALRYVEGDYFIYCGDDDSFARDLLKILDQYVEGDGAEGVYWRQALYYHPSWFDEHRAGKLYIPLYTGRNWLIEAKDAIRQMFDLNMPKTFPVGMSFCFKTSIVRSVLREYGVFFPRPFPDYTSTMMYLPSITKYLYLDMALTVIGKSADSNAASTMNGPKDRVKQFVVELNGQLYPHMPLHHNLVLNGIAECVKSVQSVRSKELGTYDLDWVRYFRGMYDALILEREFLESGHGEYEYWKQVLKLPVKQRIQIANYVLRVKAFMMRKKTRQAFNRSPKQLSTNGAHEHDVCKKLSSLAECSQELSEHNRELGYF